MYKILAFNEREQSFESFQVNQISHEYVCPAWLKKILPIYHVTGRDDLGYIILMQKKIFYLYLFLADANEELSVQINTQAEKLLSHGYKLTQVSGIMKVGTKYFSERVSAEYDHQNIPNLEKKVTVFNESYKNEILSIIEAFNHFECASLTDYQRIYSHKIDQEKTLSISKCTIPTDCQL